MDALQLKVTADVSDLDSAMSGAASKVEASTSQMNAGFQLASNGAKEAGESAVLAGEEMTTSFGEARGAAALLGEEVGVKLNRHLRGVLATSETLGPILNAAFPVVAAIGFIEIAEHVGEKLASIISDTFIYTQAMKDEEAAQKKTNDGILQEVEALDKLKDEYDLIGLSGTARTRVEFDKLNESVKKNEQALREAQNALYEYRNPSAPNPVTGASGEVSGQQAADAQRQVSAITAILNTQYQQEANLQKEFELQTKSESDRAAQEELARRDALMQDAQRRAQAGIAFHQQALAAQSRDTQENQAFELQGLHLTQELEKSAGEEAAKAAQKGEKAWHEYLAGRVVEEENAARAAQAAYALRGDQDKLNVATGQMTPADRLADLKAALDAEYAAEKAALERKLALLRLDPTLSPQALNKALGEIQQLKAKYAEQGIQLATQETTADEKLWEKAANQINADLARVLTGHESVAKAMMQLETQLAEHAIESMLKGLEQYLLTQHSKVLADAKGAAAGAYNAVVGIPYVGPILAPIAAGVAFGGVMAFDTFEEGGVVPRTGVAMVHAGERMLTPSMNQMFEQLVANGGHTFNSGDIHIGGVSDPVQAARLARAGMRADFKRMLRDNGLGRF